MKLHLGWLVALVLTIPQSLLWSRQDAVQPTDAATRLAWHRQHLEMREASPWKDLNWRFIGPLVMSGRVTDVAIPPGSRYTFYVATASGGLWKTVNEGTTWQPIFDDAPSASTGDVAVAPSRPEVVWVGLGEANIFRSSMSGTGVYKSEDAGQSWTHMGLAETHHIARIVIHPSNPNQVYVAASGREWTTNPDRGVYRTTNGGITWEQVLFVNEQTGAIDLVMDPEAPDTLYAAMWDRTRLKWSDPLPGPGSGIWKTRDAGQEWVQLENGLPPRETTGRIGLAMAESRPDTIYAVIDNHALAREAEEGELDSYGRPRRGVIKGAEVYRSDDGGERWNLVSEPSSLERVFSTYGWVFGQIRVDPTDENTVFVLGVPLMKSTDGGRTWRNVRYPGLHGDHHALWIDPEDPRHLINGNDGGVNLSYDGGETWKDLDNLGVVQFYNVAYDMAEPFRIYGSIQDNGTYRGPSNHRPGRDPGHDWEQIPGGEASYVAVDPSDPNVLYSESFYGRIQRSTLEPRQTVSITPTAAPDEPPLRGQWLAPFLLSPHNPYVVYHGMQAVFRSVDRGDHWERISPDLSHDDPGKQGNIPYQTITSLSESPLRFGLLYAGTDDGRVWVTRNGGNDWQEIVEGLPSPQWVSRVVASQHDESTVYLAQNGKRDNELSAWLWRSQDHGAHWESIANGLPGGPINVVREDPRHAGILFVGTDLGVYASSDSAATWQVLGRELPVTFVHDLIVHPRDPVMVIATHGRGMWRLDLEPFYAQTAGTPESVTATPPEETAAPGEAEADPPPRRRRFED